MKRTGSSKLLIATTVVFLLGTGIFMALAAKETPPKSDDSAITLGAVSSDRFFADFNSMLKAGKVHKDKTTLTVFRRLFEGGSMKETVSGETHKLTVLVFLGADWR